MFGFLSPLLASRCCRIYLHLIAGINGTACGGAIVISVSITIANVIPLGLGAILSYAGIIFAVLIVYTSVGLTFRWVITAGLLGGILGVLCTSILGVTINWSLLHRTYTCASILGIGLSYPPCKTLAEYLLTF